MTTEETLIEQIHSLPKTSKKEVLHFVQFLKSKTDSKKNTLYDSEWQDFSLNSAMQGMEEEATPYTVTDIKEQL